MLAGDGQQRKILPSRSSFRWLASTSTDFPWLQCLQLLHFGCQVLGWFYEDAIMKNPSGKCGEQVLQASSLQLTAPQKLQSASAETVLELLRITRDLLGSN